MKRIYKYISPHASALLRTLPRATAPVALALALLLTPSLTSCRKVEVDPALDGKYEIAFDQVTTKALITDENLTSFKVWGETEQGTANVFNGVDVTGAVGSEWTYYTNDNEAKYWEENKTYNFFAVAPSTMGSLVHDDTKGYGVSYEISENMAADPVDLVVATATRITERLDKEPENVQLNFFHTLSKVQVQLTKSDSNEKQVITVKEVYLYGMKGDGIYYFNSEWTLGTDAATMYRTGLEQNLGLDYISFGEFMMIPQVLSQDTVYLIVSFDYTNGSVTSPRVQIAPVPVADVNEWEAGKSYTYKAEISIEHDMILEITDVEDWVSNNEGGTIIIK